MNMDLEAILVRLSEAEHLLERVNSFKKDETHLEGSLKLANRIKSEIRFLEKLKNGKVVFKQSHLISTNLTSLTAAIDAVEVVGFFRISSVLLNVNYVPKVDPLETQQSICIDIVANKGHVWVKVIARNASALYSSMLGQGQFGDRSLLDVAEQFVDAADQNHVDFKPPRIIFRFAHGLPAELGRKLDKLGILVDGEVVSGFEEEDFSSSEDEEEKDHHVEVKTILMKEYLEQHFDDLRSNSSQSLLSSNYESFPAVLTANLDITTLLSLVSNICNGGNYYKYGIPVLDEQARQERENPVLPKLNEFLKNKKLIVCETAVKSFQTIVATIGGPNEKERTEALLKKITVVPDIMSDRTLNLKSSGKINKRSKVIFGSGDYYKATTVTANTGYVRAASQNGVQYSVFIHDARALTENKETDAILCNEPIV
ncbi:UPF0415 protein C7orf25-like [Ciona intestinalis]